MADDNTNTPQLPSGSGQETGASGTYFFKGYITAEEYSIDLQGKYGLQVYDVMRKSDPTVRAALQVCKQPILGADWSIEPASNDPRDQEIAQRLTHELFNRSIDYHEIMRENLNFLDMGFAVAELVYEIAEWEGKPYVGIKKIASRKQRSILKWEQDNGSPGVTQILPSGKNVNGTGGSTANIPRDKLLVVVNDQEGENYFGFPILRYAYKPWKLKDGLEIMNAVALENMAIGIPYIKKGIDGQTIDESELAKIRNRLRQQRANEEGYLEFPASIEVGWMDMKGNTTKEVIPTIEYQDRQILLSVLAQFLLLGANDAAGSRAVSQDHSRLFVKALVAVAKQWQLAFQRDVVNKWVDLNYSNLENGYPKLIFSTISDEDVKEVSQAVSTLMTAGALKPDRDIENRLRKMLNLPPLSDEDYENYEKNQKAIQATKQQTMPQPDDPNPQLPPAGSPVNPENQPQDLPKEDKSELTAAIVIAEARRAQRKLLSLVGGY